MCCQTWVYRGSRVGEYLITGMGQVPFVRLGGRGVTFPIVSSVRGTRYDCKCDAVSCDVRYGKGIIGDYFFVRTGFLTDTKMSRATVVVS